MIQEETAAERVSRLSLLVLCGVLALDLTLVVVTGGMSILTPGTRVTPAAFAIREVLLAVVILTRFRLLAPTSRRLSAGRAMLVLAVIPALYHLHVTGRRITGDAVYYYVFTRSMLRDADVDFANEYAHYDLMTRGDHVTPTNTGHRRTIYAIGPGLLWAPFFVAADGLAAGMEAAGFDVDTSGYGPLHLNAVALGSFAYGIAALFVIHAFLRRHFGDRLAAGATLLLWWASFLPWYLSEQPLTSHAVSLLLVSAFFLLRQRGALDSDGGSLALGLALGLAMCVRWQSGVYLLLPAVDLLLAWRDGTPFARVARRGGLIGVAVFIGALPQMLAWKAIYDLYLLPYPPQGTDFVRPFRPYLLNTLFSSRHGLLSWTPVFWPCLVGLFMLTRRRPRTFGILWAPLLIMTWVNAATGDWWAGGSFSNRRFDTLLPVFALGLAAFLERAVPFLRRRPSTALAALVLGAGLWSLTWTRAQQRGDAGSVMPTRFEARALGSAQALSNDIGFPTTWPASWIFAARYDASPGAFDLAAGKYLFYRQNNLEGLADIGEEGDGALVLDGFSAPRRDGGTTYRALEREGRILVTLDLPITLGIAVRARDGAGGTGRIEVEINGHRVGEVGVQPAWSEGPLQAPLDLWKRGPNVVTLRADHPADIDRVTFERIER